MHPYSVSSILSAVIMAYLGAFVLMRDPKGSVNRVFMLLCLSMSYWAFTEFQLRNAESYDRARFWLQANAVWPVSVGLMLHFACVFTGRLSARRRLLRLAAIYGPALVFSGLNVVVISHQPLQVDWGWTAKAPVSGSEMAYVALTYVWGLATALFSLLLCVRYALAAATRQTRKMGKHVSIGLACVVVPSFLSEALLPLVLRKPVVELTASSCAVMAAFITYAVVKYELFPLTPVTAAESIVATISDPLFLVDLDYNIQTVNRAACVMLGYQTHELLGHALSKVFSGPAVGSSHTDFMKRLKTGVVSNVETEFVTRDGARIPVSLSWSVTRRPDGTVIGMTFVGRNMTERLRLEDSLRKARDELQSRVEEQTRELTVTNRMLRQEIAERMKVEEQLAQDKDYLTVTLASIADGVIATDSAGRVMLFNRVAEELTGWTATEAQGRALADVFALFDEEKRENTFDPLAALEEGGAGMIHRCEGVLTARDGTKRFVAESAASIRHADGKVRGMVLVFRDITEQRRTEERLLKTRRLEAVSTLAAGIAREFGEVFANVMNFLFVARTHLDPSSEPFRMLEPTEKAVFRASSLTRQLLSMAGEEEPIRDAVSMRELIVEAAGYSMANAEADYVVEVPDSVGQVYVNRGQIHQALSSVIVNAAEAMPEGGTVRIKAERRQIEAAASLPVAEGEYVVVSVSDQGKGIPSEFLHRVFDPYFTTKPGHSGLGLTMAFGMLTKHGGYIELESQPEGGTTVLLYVPSRMPAASVPHDPRRAAEDTSRLEVHLLFMDDQESVRNSTARLLTHLGYRTKTAADGDEAVRLYREASERGEPFDAVILDLFVHEGKGALETLAELKRIDPGVRAIVCSAYPTEPVMERFADLGFAAALVKPFSMETLDGTVRRVLCNPT